MNDLKAIETVYKGYRFRSRLEARWAVFFDECNEPWEYEPEGYDLGLLGYYLPDFWMPNMQAFLEIKGAKPTESEYAKVAALRDVTGKAAMIFHGMLDPGMVGRVYCWDDNDSSAGASDWDIQLYGDHNGEIWPYINEPRSFYADMTFSVPWGLIDSRCHPMFLSLACDAAKSARFEHGERQGVRVEIVGRSPEMSSLYKWMVQPPPGRGE